MKIRSGADAPVPVTILTGFLGAGKTTLLNRILTGDHGLKVGVLVNDFGSINIDAELVAGVEDDLVSLANGCVCCEIRDDLVDAVGDLLERVGEIEYIILEASGVADPAAIYSSFADPQYHDRVQLDSVTCVVDTARFLTDSEEYPGLVMIKARQIAAADLVILNKVDLAGPELVEYTRKWIDHNMRRVRMIEAVGCDVPYDVLLAVGRFDPATQFLDQPAHDDGSEDRDSEVHGAHDHGDEFVRWSYESDVPFDLERLAEMIKRELPGSVYRCKGILFVDADPDRRFVLQSVGRRSEITEGDGWGNRPHRSQIVAIAVEGGIDGETLSRSFERCLSDSG